VLDRLVETLLRTAIEQAGAERGLLILPHGSELLIQAEAQARGSSVAVHLREAPVSAQELPESIVRHAARTRENVILDDASARNPFSGDEYIRQRRPRSVLCLPLVEQGALVALLYMENNLGPNFFAPDRIVVLKVLASQAAISLDNSRLYRELQEREGRIRRLVDANVIGILISDSEGQILECNDAFLKMVGYSREELVSGRMRWRDMTPAEWKEASEHGVVQVRTTGACKAFEKEYYRKDGSRVPVLVGAARFEKSSIVAFAIDLTERKRAEEAIRRSEAFLAEAQRLSHTGSFGWQPDAGEILWSDETYRIFEYERSRKPTLDMVLQRIHADDRARAQQVIERAARAGTDFELEHRLLVPGGAIKHVHVRAHTHRDSAGKIEFIGAVTDISERKKAEEGLKSSEAYLAEAQRLSHTGSWAWSPASSAIVYWSEECYRILGHDPTKGLPSFAQLMEDVHPEDRPQLAESLEKAVAARGEWQAEYRLVNFAGGARAVRCMAHPIVDGAGQVLEYVGTVMDITEQRRAEEERRVHLWFLESMDRINRAMQRKNDVEGMTSGVLEETLAIFGADRTWLVYPCDPDAPSCRVVMKHARPEYPAALEVGDEFPVDAQEAASLRRALESPGAVDLDVEPDIRERFNIQSVVAIAVRPRADRPYLFGLHQCSQARAWTAAERRLFEEIARRLEDALTSVLAHRNLLASQEELRRSRAYLAEAQKLSQTGSWAWSPEGHITYWSEECYRVLGFDPQDGLPRSEEFFQRIHPDDLPAFSELAWKAVRENAQLETDYRVVHPDGSVRVIHVVGGPVLSKSGDLVVFVGTVIDITDHKRAEEERREHLWFLESMDRINRAMQRSNDVELMTNGVMQEALEIFASDRASLTYPCDPETPTFRTVMEHTSREYGGVLTMGRDRPLSPEGAEIMRRALHHPGTVVDPSLSPELREPLRIVSLLAIAVRPKGDRPYLLVVHCERSRRWTAAELRLFEEIARRLGDALTSVLAQRNQLASQEALQALSRDLQESNAKLEEAQRLAHVGHWEWDLRTDRVNWSDETYRIYGMRPHEHPMDIATVQEKIHPADWERGLEEALGGDRFSVECRVFRPTGEVRLVILEGDVKRDASGKPYWMFGTIQDITERKRAEDQRREHMWFLESMDRINRALQRTNDVEAMMSGVLEEALAIFGCDRAWLVHPCDPDAPAVRAVMERTSPDYPGAFALGEEFPVDAIGSELLRNVLLAPGVVENPPIAPGIRERFSIQSMIAVAVRPKGNLPYLFGLTQCSHSRAWTAAERRIFGEAARRLQDVLTSVLAHRDLLASQEDLRTNEQRFRTFVDHATDSFFLYDDEDIVRDVNRQACDTTGYSRDELIGMHPMQFNAGLTPEKVDWIRAQLHEHGHVTFTNLRLRKDGTHFPVEVRARAFKRGGRIFTIALATDITERRRREQCLLAQHGVTKALSEATSVDAARPLVLRAIGEALGCDFGVIWCVDEQGVALRCSETWSPPSATRPAFDKAMRATTFGPGVDLPGRVWSTGTAECVPDLAADASSARTRLAANEELHAAFALPVARKSGITGVIEFFSRKRRDADPELLQMMATVGAQVGQFLERTRAEDALRTARSELAHVTRVTSMGELTASIAHEVNQPLGAMVTSAASASRWLAAKPPNLEKAWLALARIAADGERASKVIDRMRMLVKRQEPGREPTDVNETIGSVVALMRDELERAGVAHATRLADHLPPVLSDRVLLQQVILNLILNAIDAMKGIEDRARVLRIESRLDDGGEVRVQVRDTGSGLPPDARLFEAFYTTKERGLGMGLSISRSIVEEHGGRMRARPNDPHGAIFEFSLPVTQA
jgi:PAS domain S-box-containing protein